MPYNKKLVLGFMAQLLHPTGDVNIDFFPVNQGFWDSIVRLSSSHLVLTAFHGAIRRKKLENFVPKKLLVKRLLFFFCTFAKPNSRCFDCLTLPPFSLDNI